MLKMCCCGLPFFCSLPSLLILLLERHKISTQLLHSTIPFPPMLSASDPGPLVLLGQDPEHLDQIVARMSTNFGLLQQQQHQAALELETVKKQRTGYKDMVEGTAEAERALAEHTAAHHMHTTGTDLQKALAVCR